MKIKNVLLSCEYSISLEFFPPKEEKAFEEFTKGFTFYQRLNPNFVSVTYGAGGSTREKTFSLVKFIKEKYDIPVMPHLTSLTHSPEEIENLLQAYAEIGVENILALRGDIPKDVGDFDISKAYFKNALGFVRFIKERFGSTFSIGVSAYPEGYPEYRDVEKEVEYLKRKFDEGGDFAITQMFFDNSYFYKFVNICRKKGITNEVIPGIMPITNFKQIFSFATSVGARIPDDLTNKFNSVLSSPEDMEKLGIEVAVSQIMDLFDNGFKKIHLFTLNRRSVVEDIVRVVRARVMLQS